MSNPNNQNEMNLAEKLGETRIGVRKDVIVSRLLFRDQPSYIIHDPLSFTSQRFNQGDYEILSHLDREKTLAETFAQLLQKGLVEAEDEHGFYEFVLQLQVKGLLDLPITNSSAVYNRYELRKQMQEKASVMKYLFLKVGLLNPNAFLDRTVRLFKPLFTKAAFVFWCVLMIVCGGILFGRAGDFFGPLANILATENLLIIALVMTGLKVIHEFGHAYACKAFGGAVPDMGALFIASLPCAYVDVSSSWSFSSRRNRIIVAIGGMYFETLVAGIALIVWSMTTPGLINSIAQFTVLMASFTTLLFNANPLMKFDGYYVLSDLLGIPNLRQRSTDTIKNFSKKTFLGLPATTFTSTRKEYMWLFLFGVCSAIYSVTLMVSISFMVAQQFGLVGFAMACLMLGSLFLGLFKSLFAYLLASPECEPVRSRAILCSGLIAALVPVFLFLTPASTGIVGVGETGYEQQVSINARHASQLAEQLVFPGEEVQKGQCIARLDNGDVNTQFHLASAQLELAKAQYGASTSQGPGAMKANMASVEAAKAEVQRLINEKAHLQVTAPISGRVVKGIPSGFQGMYVPEGTELVQIVSGNPVINVLFDEEQLTGTHPKIGLAVKCRLSSMPGKTIAGEITRIEQAGSREVPEVGLTQLAEGSIVVNPGTGEAQQPYFRLEVQLDGKELSEVPVGTTVRVQLPRKFESVGGYLFRRIKVFYHKLTTQ